MSWDGLIVKLNNLKTWQVISIFVIVGFAVFFTGLTSPFQGDDIGQIVNNVPVHSITNIRIFFEGSTFYEGNGIAPLHGVYYRPLMSTTFSFLYTLFGLHTFYFHLLQLLLYIGSAVFFFLFLAYFFAPVLALLLSLVYLVHPLNSQVVYAIPSMGDALFFFFGILAMWLLLRFNTLRSLITVALCLFLSMISKEAGAFFIVMASVYLLWFDRKRLLLFINVVALPVVLYVALKTQAVGFLGTNPNIAPIDFLGNDRFFTIPSLVLFYISKFIFPWKLASGYYWVYTSFSFRNVLIPFVIDLAVIAVFVYLGFVVHRRLPKMSYFYYLFFAVWAVLGLIVCLQIVPFDMTACETWFYFPMAGVLGMIGVALSAVQDRVQPKWFIAIAVLLVGALGVRTAIRGTDWSNEYTLAKNDIAASKEDYNAYNYLAQYYIDHGNYNEAKLEAQHSTEIYPTWTNYTKLGIALTNLGEYANAKEAYNQALGYSSNYSLYVNLSALTLFYGNFSDNEQFLDGAVQELPQNGEIWMYKAIYEEKSGDTIDAKTDILNAVKYTQVPQQVYAGIMGNQPFEVELVGRVIQIH